MLGLAPAGEAGGLGLGWNVAVTRPAAVILLLYFYVLASSAVSISTKSVTLGLFMAMVMTMLRPDAPTSLAPARRA